MVVGGFFLIQAIGFCQAGTQSDLLNETSKHEKVLDITVGEWPPYLSEKLNHSGVVSHMIENVFLDMGIKVRFHFLPWARAYEETGAGRFDGTALWLRTSSREKDFFYSAPILTEKLVFFHLKSYDFDWNELKDLEGTVLGGNLKASYGPRFDAALEAGLLDMDRVSGYKQNFDRLLLGRIQLFPMEVNVGYFLLRKHFSKKQKGRVTHHKKAIFDNFSYLLFPKENTKSLELRNSFDKHLKLFRDSGRYGQFMNNLLKGRYDRPE